MHKRACVLFFHAGLARCQVQDLLAGHGARFVLIAMVCWSAVVGAARTLKQDCYKPGYVFYQQKDSLYNDIQCNTTSDASDFVQQCSNNPECQAVNIQIAGNNLWVCQKWAVVAPLPWYAGLPPTGCFGIYIKECPAPAGYSFRWGEEAIGEKLTDANGYDCKYRPTKDKNATLNDSASECNVQSDCVAFQFYTNPNTSAQWPHVTCEAKTILDLRLTSTTEFTNFTPPNTTFSTRSACDGIFIKESSAFAPLKPPSPPSPSPPSSPSTPPPPPSSPPTPPSPPSRPPSPPFSPPPPPLKPFTGGSQSKSKSGVVVGAVVGPIAGVTVLLLLLLWWWCRKRKQHQDTPLNIPPNASGPSSLYGDLIAGDRPAAPKTVPTFFKVFGNEDTTTSSNSAAIATPPFFGKLFTASRASPASSGTLPTAPIAGDGTVVVTAPLNAQRNTSGTATSEHIATAPRAPPPPASYTSQSLAPTYIAVEMTSPIAPARGVADITVTKSTMVTRDITGNLWRRKLSNLIIPWRDLSIDENGLLGKGGFGEVYKGKWQGVIPVAVKMLDLNHSSDGVEELCREALVMCEMPHPCIASVYGVVDDADHAALVMKYYKNGALDAAMSKGKYAELGLVQRLEMAQKVASGMRCLHERKPAPIIHGDLKTSNLLIDDDGQGLVIADFGLARCLREGQTGRAIPSGAGTPSISPPEVFANPFAPRTTAGDVYAFGVVLFEIIVGRPAFQNMRRDEISRAVKAGGRPSMPEDVPEDVANLIKDCWQQDPSKRPAFVTAVERLGIAADACKMTSGSVINSGRSWQHPSSQSSWNDRSTTWY